MAGKFYWIKERINPQIGTYFVKCGNITVAEAKKNESPLYGYNIMHRFNTYQEYENEIARLEKNGERVQ